MRPQRAFFIPAVFGLLLAPGCVSVPRDAGFNEVGRIVREETGQPLAWNPEARIVEPTDEESRRLLTGELTVERTVQIAIANNRDLQAKLEELGIAQADLIEASTVRNPLLHGEIRFPGEPRNPVEFELTQSLIDLLQIRSRRAFGRAAFAAARTRVAGAVINFAAEVRTDYYDLQAAQLILARQQLITEASRISAELASRQHFAGNISDLDLENEQALYEQAKLDLARSQLDELNARERLITDLGFVGPPAEIRLPAQFSEIPREEPSVQDVDRVALSRRLDLTLAQQELETARAALPIARVAVLDELEADAHHEREPDGTRTTGPGVTVPIPIFNTGRAQRQRAIATLRRAEQRVYGLRVTAQSEARAARERLLEARARAVYIRDVVLPRRQRILNLTQLEYNAMLRGVFQLIQARQNLSNADRDLVLAQRDYWIARTDLDTALSGVSRFSIRSEGALLSRPELFRARSPLQTKEIL